ncbi:hypothetical protein HGRIS_014976 [Hohenbuehelia grisea]|uniref:Uncharacterized protein n=1 Tax=Hohenbuehelia grisea TaxID=104357 RepID=A0ABR3IVM2_9AGAR
MLLRTSAADHNASHSASLGISGARAHRAFRARIVLRMVSIFVLDISFSRATLSNSFVLRVFDLVFQPRIIFCQPLRAPPLRPILVIPVVFWLWHKAALGSMSIRALTMRIWQRCRGATRLSGCGRYILLIGMGRCLPSTCSIGLNVF